MFVFIWCGYYKCGMYSGGSSNNLRRKEVVSGADKILIHYRQREMI